MKRAIATSPLGTTPLTQHIRAIREKIAVEADRLRARGQNAVIVLATDGVPSDETGVNSHRAKTEFIQALRELQGLP
eukprot:CAMPEP_0185774520 /NCGR_PEP_ID=MMETSP1174-20130828/78635_1 /TAXON_ID=35687 /ORGANISM="Dictyocha speculum, Strain CCMP1381" /LENGTH=76 /DNA_ID=CAMNT_0028461729 /DNA_START=15 /DNA_END=241 /DNA_ORIENTATION=+